MLQGLGQTEKATELYSQALLALQAGQKIEFSADYQLGAIAQGLAKAGQVDRAIQVVQLLPNTPDELYTKVSTLIGIAAELHQQNQSEKAIVVLTQALNLTQQMPENSNKITVLTWLASVNITVGRIEEAKKILAQIMQFPSSLREENSGILSYLFEQLGQIDQAVTIAQAEGQGDALVSFVNRNAAKKQYDQAFKVAQAIRSPEVQAEALAAIAVQYTQQGDKEKGFTVMQQAMKIAQTAKSPGLNESDAGYQDAIISSILSGYLSTGEQD